MATKHPASSLRSYSDDDSHASVFYPFLNPRVEAAIVAWCDLQSSTVAVPILQSILSFSRTRFSGTLVKTLKPQGLAGPRGICFARGGETYIVDDSPKAPLSVLSADGSHVKPVPVQRDVFCGGCGGIVQLPSGLLAIADPFASKIQLLNPKTNMLMNPVELTDASRPRCISLLPPDILAVSDLTLCDLRFLGVQVTQKKTTVTEYRRIRTNAPAGPTALVLNDSEIAVLQLATKKAGVYFYSIPVVMSSGSHMPTATCRIGSDKVCFPNAICSFTVAFPGDHVLISDCGSASIRMFSAASGDHLLTVGLPMHCERAVCSSITVDEATGEVVVTDRCTGELHFYF